MRVLTRTTVPQTVLEIAANGMALLLDTAVAMTGTNSELKKFAVCAVVEALGSDLKEQLIPASTPIKNIETVPEVDVNGTMAPSSLADFMILKISSPVRCVVLAAKLEGFRTLMLHYSTPV